MSSEYNEKELPRTCPLLEKEIACEECYEIGMVAEGWFPKSELPPGMVLSEEKTRFCLNCEYHVH